MKSLRICGSAFLVILTWGCSVQVVVPLEVTEELNRSEQTIAYVSENVVLDDSGKVMIRLVGQEDPIVKYVRELKLNDRAKTQLTESLRSRAKRWKSIREIKMQGLVGESREGTLAYIPAAPAARTLERDELIEAENRDRETIISIFAASLAQGNNEDTAARYRAQLRREFVAILQRPVLPGEWIQTPDGQWVKK